MNNTNILTQREIEIAHLVVEGKTNKEIGEILCISFHTVKAHLENIFRKLEVKNRVQLGIKIIRLINIHKKEDDF